MIALGLFLKRVKVLYKNSICLYVKCDFLENAGVRVFQNNISFGCICLWMERLYVDVWMCVFLL